PRAAPLGATGMILGAFYLIWMLRRLIFGPRREPSAHDGQGDGKAQGDQLAGPPDHGHVACPPLGWHEIAGLAPLMFLIVAIGVYPRPIFEHIQPAVHTIVQNIATQQERAREEALKQRGVTPMGTVGTRRGGAGSSGPARKAAPGQPKAASPRTKAAPGQPKAAPGQPKAAPSAKSTQKGGR